MEENVLYTIGRAIIPKKVRPYLRSFLLKSGYYEVPYPLFGVLFFVSAASTYLVWLLFFYPGIKEQQYNAFKLAFLSGLVFGVTMFIILFSLAGMLYFYWNLKVYHRTKELERLLPEYLTLVSTNLKGGMSFENALWSAIKPEFGILANEIGLVSKRVMTGNEVNDALLEFALKYDSPILRRNIQLLTSELESGGRVVDVIDRIISDMKKTHILKKEMAASTVNYMIFIGMLVGIICPVLFALSLQLFTTITGFVGQLSNTISSNPSGIRVGALGVSVNDFRLFSVMAISLISVCSSMIIAIIERGDIKAGLKYIPMFLATSLVVYAIASGLLGFVFSGLKAFG